MGRTIVRFDAAKPAPDATKETSSNNTAEEHKTEYVVDDNLLKQYFTELVGDELTAQLQPLWRTSRPSGEPIAPNYTEWRAR